MRTQIELVTLTRTKGKVVGACAVLEEFSHGTIATHYSPLYTNSEVAKRALLSTGKWYWTNTWRLRNSRTYK